MDTPLRRFALERHGLLMAADLTSLGLTWHEFKNIADDEGWTRLFRGCYVHPEIEDSPVLRARAIQLGRPKAVVSHQLAAFIHGFDVNRAVALDFTCRDRSRWTLPLSGRLHRWHIADDDIEEIDGLLVTTAERTVVDLMRALDRDQAVIALDSALRRGAVDLRGVAQRLDRLGGDRGVKAAWQSFAVADPRSESATESKVRLIMWDRQLYARSQVVIKVSEVETRRIDLEVDGLFVECEGKQYHAPEDTYEADIRRFNALTNALPSHHSAIRVTWREAFLHSARAGGAIVAAHRAHLRRIRAYRA